MTDGALAFMVFAWAFVLGLTGWCFYRLLKADVEDDRLPPPDTSL